MAKTINLVDNQCSENDEVCIIDDLSIPHDDVNAWARSKTSVEDEELIAKALEFVNKMSEIKNTRYAIQSVKYSKDNILYRIIKLAHPPFYIKKELMNYKALVLYFMRDFRGKIALKYNDFSNTAVVEPTTLKNDVFDNQDKLMIKTEMEALLHLINVDKEKIKAKDIYERILYDTVGFGEYIKSETHFHSKIASIGWIKGTLNKPDFIYTDSSLIAKDLQFDVCFIRKTGNGKASQKYMYHLVGLKRIKGNLYTIVSQFPIEKDREYSDESKNISRLHKIIQCNNHIYQREGVDEPLYSEELNSDDSAIINKLKNGFGSNM